MAAVATKIHSGERLSDVLQAVADAVVEHVGFDVAVVNLRRPNDDFEIVAVAGSQECADTLRDGVIPAATVRRWFAACEEWGSLRFLSYEQAVDDDGATTWTPDFTPLDGPDAWHPEDMLLAPLLDPDGTIVGLLSLDMPTDRRRPGAMQRELVEVLAGQAGLAISAAQLTTQLRQEHERLQAEQARLRSSEEAFRFSFDRSATGMALVGIEGPETGIFLRVNSALGALLGHPPEDLIGSSLLGFVSDDDVAAIRTVLAADTNGAVVTSGDYQVSRRSGSQAWLSLTSTVIDGTASQPPFLLLHAEDASARIAREELLVFAAGHDPLTSLPNRRLIIERLDQALRRIRVGGGTTTVMFCDLDHFKNINDREGHRVGDQVLEVVGARLQAQVRIGDTVGRLGGDEFVVLADDIGFHDARGLRDRIRESVGAPFDQPGDARLGMSIGVLTVDRACAKGHDALGILQLGDEAMYRDKTRRQLGHVPIAVNGEMH